MPKKYKMSAERKDQIIDKLDSILRQVENWKDDAVARGEIDFEEYDYLEKHLQFGYQIAIA